MKTRFTGIVAAVFSLAIASGQGNISTFFSTGSSGLAIDTQGNVYLTESSTARVRKISSGVLSTIAGNGNFGYAGDGGQAINATLNLTTGGLSGLAVDGSVNLYFSDSANNVIRKINASGVISTYAGNGTGAGTGFGGFAGDNGLATSAQLDTPTDIAIDSNGNLYICDTFNSRVRKVTPGGTITTFAGNGHVAFEGDGVQASTTSVPSPGGIAVDTKGNVYISSALRVRKVTPDGIINTIAGNGTRGFSGDGGLATAASFRGPIGLAVDQFGNVYVTDNGNGRVRKIDAAGIITTYAGIDGNASTALGDGGPATSAYLGTVGDLMLDSSGNLYVSTGGGSGRIRKIAPAGAGLVSSPSSVTFSYTIGGTLPASQTLSITSTGGVLAYTTSASSAGNWLSVSPGNSSTPGTLTVSANSAGLGGGTTYQGTILLTPTVAGNSPLSIDVSLTVTGAGAPVIDPGRILNTSGDQQKLAPGVVWVIYGKNLGPAALTTAVGPNYPDSVGGTSVSFTPLAGGSAITAKIWYTLATQAGGFLPSSMAPGIYAVRVTYNGLTSPPQNVTVVARSMGIGTSNGVGNGPAQATIANVNGGLSLVRYTTGSVDFGGYHWILTPAHPDDTVVFWGTGGGADLANDTGGSSGDQTSAGNFIVTVGTRKIVPSYAGAVAGYPGLWQINVHLPPDIRLDCFSPVQVSAGGETGNMASIAIAPPGKSICTGSGYTDEVLAKLDAGQDIVTGAFALSQIGKTQTGAFSDGLAGFFGRYTPTAFVLTRIGPKFDACEIYDRTYLSSDADPSGPYAFLDGGATLPLSGPSITANTAVIRSATPTGPYYSLSPPIPTLVTGDYTMTGLGGNDVGKFSVTANFSNTFAVTNWDATTSVDRTKPLTFNWTGSGSDLVYILVNSITFDGPNLRIVTMNCYAPAAPGSYTISPEALAYMPPVPESGSIGFGSIAAESFKPSVQVTAPLTSGGKVDFIGFASDRGYSKNAAIK